MLHRTADAQHQSSLLERVPANRFALHCWALWHFRQVSSDFLHGHEIRVRRLSQLLVELVDGCNLAQPALSGFVVEVHRLHHAAVVRHVFQRRRVYNGCLAAFEAFVGDVRFAFYDLWLGAPLEWSLWELGLLLDLEFGVRSQCMSHMQFVHASYVQCPTTYSCPYDAAVRPRRSL
jgi:hypothetical protein